MNSRPSVLILSLFLVMPFMLLGQHTTRIAASAVAGKRFVQTDVYLANEPCCGQYNTGEGAAYGAGIELSMSTRVADAVGLRVISGLFSFSAVDRWTEPGDQLPSLAPDGSVVTSTSEHQLRLKMHGMSVLLGGGLEYGGVSIVPVVRLTYLFDASTHNSMHLLSRDAAFDPSLIGPDVEYFDQGRGVRIQTLGPDDHRQLLFDLGLQIGYHVGFEVFTVPFDVELQV